MNNNDVLKRLRYTFNFSDQQMISLFEEAGKTVNRSEVSNWLKPEKDEEFKTLYDKDLAYFLNGFIMLKRGKDPNREMKAESKMNNNLVLRKLKIALSYKDTDMLEILDLADFRMGKGELNNFFRAPSHPKFMKCKDQILRNFLMGLQLKHRPKEQN